MFEETVVRWEGRVTQQHLKEVEADWKDAVMCAVTCDEQTEGAPRKAPRLTLTLTQPKLKP